MTYRPFRSLGRILLAACAVSLGVASLGAQTPAPAAPAAPGSNPSRFDIFTGYSYFGAHGRLQPEGRSVLVRESGRDRQRRVLLQ